MTRRNPWASLEAAEKLGNSLGYKTRRVDLRDINQTVMLELDGHGELVEVYFQVSGTGYLAYQRTFVHGGVSGDRIPTWRRTRDLLQGLST